MANIVPFAQAQVPAHIQKEVGGGLANIPEKINIPQLSFRGKVWRQVIDGEERTLVNKEDEPVSTVHIIVLNHNKARSRAFYEGAFEEGKSQPPACWSSDGDTPDPDVKEPQAKSCAKCPNSVKGSKITPNGKETTACSVFKRLAVVPLSDLSCPPMLLRLAQTSMWDKNNAENEEKGYYAWDQYLDMLRARGALHTGLVATKVRFDSRVAYPKLVFAASRWLEPEELKEVKPLFESEEVLKLLNASEAKAAERKPATEKDDEDEVVPPKKSTKAAPKDEDEEEPAPPKKAKKSVADDEDEPAPVKAKPNGKTAPVADEEEEEPAPPKKAKKPVVIDADEEESAPAPKKAKKAAPAEDEEESPAPKGKAKKTGDGLADLVEEFDD